MPYPENPNTIILKNKFYPKGLSELDVWKYYQSRKGLIIKEVKNRDLMFFILTKLNVSIIKRKLKDKFIKLNSSNYDNIITGRTISIHSSMNKNENIGIIDIDSDDWKKSKLATIDVYNEMIKAPFILDLQIRYTGKTSFHIFCNLRATYKIEAVRVLFKTYLDNTNIAKQYTIGPSRTKGIPNIDLWASNKFRGNFITLNSLSIWGLKCMEVKYRDVMNFTPYKAIVK